MQRDQSLEADYLQTEQLQPHKEAEQNEESPDKGDVAVVSANQKGHFFSVANAMLAALHPHSPELVIPEGLTRGEREAVKLLYEAKSAQETEQASGRIAATERLRYMQLALLKLQGVMAMARNPEFFGQARAHIEELRRRLARLKDELQQAIIDEERKKSEEKDKKKADEKKSGEEAKAKKQADVSLGKKA